MRIYKKTRFDAAHYLPEYDGACSKLHGHSWVVEIGVEGEVRRGMVIDFKKLKSFLEKEVEQKFDHTLLNNKIENPTAENLALTIKAALQIQDWDVKPCCVRVWETPDSMCEETW